MFLIAIPWFVCADLGVTMPGGDDWLASWPVLDLQPRERFLRSFAEQAAAALEAALGERGETSRRVANVVEEYREASRQVAYEVNNPLSIIKNYLSVLGSKLEKQEPVIGEMSILNEEIDRVGQIVKGLADLKPTLRQDGAEVNRVVRDVVRLFGDAEFVPDAAQIVAQTQDLSVEGNADTLKQILVNLVNNAFEAMPAGARLVSPTVAMSTGMDSCIPNFASGITGRVYPRKSWQIFFHRCAVPRAMGIAGWV